MIHLLKLSVLLRQPVKRIPQTRGGPMIAEADLDAFVEAESFRNPGAVRTWAKTQKRRMRHLLNYAHLRTFALRMLALLREYSSIAQAWRDVAEAVASEDAHRRAEIAAEGVS